MAEDVRSVSDWTAWHSAVEVFRLHGTLIIYVFFICFQVFVLNPRNLYNWGHKNNNYYHNPFGGPLSRTTWYVSRYQKNIHSLAPGLCGCYRTSLINFLHYVRSITSSLHICQVRQSFSINLRQVFFGLPRGLTFYFIVYAFFTQLFSFFFRCHNIA